MTAAMQHPSRAHAPGGAASALDIVDGIAQRGNAVTADIGGPAPTVLLNKETAS